MSNTLVRYFFSKSMQLKKEGNIYMAVRNSVFTNMKECTCLLDAFNKCKLELL